MENGKTASKESAKRRHEALLKRRKQRKIRRIVMTVLAALILIALTVFIVSLVKGPKGGKDPSETGGTEVRTSEEGTPEASSSTEAPATSRQETETPPPPETEPSSAETPTEDVTPDTEAPTSDPDVVWYGDYPGARPIEVQNGVKMPSWIRQELLTVSPVNRTGQKLEAVRNVVIHYVGNTGSSAKSNRDYFQSQQDPKEPSYNIQTSSHFIVDLDGSVLQCVPIDEVAYANYPRNYDTVSIESCHINDAGEYTQATYDGMVKLSAWLLEIHGLSADDLITHDYVRINGGIGAKSCPKWFTDHPDAWERFKNDVRSYMGAHPDIEHEFP